MVSSTHWLASGAGMAVLERGGNAFDAAVTAGLVLQVVEPHLNGPAGEVPILVHDGSGPSVVNGQGPAPSTATTGNHYGGQFWLVPDDRSDVPKDAYAAVGTRGQYVIIGPSHDLVIVRRGLDYGAQGFDRWDLTREVLKAFTGLPAAN